VLKMSVEWAKGVDKRVVMFRSAMATDSTWKVSAPKKNCLGFPMFRNSLSPIPNLSACTLCPGARETMSVVIPFDLIRK
jgi:hypothetical protein